VVYPLLPFDYGCNHGKLFAIFRKESIRIVISTANLLAKDYERKTQGIWYQDFPLKKSSLQQTESANDFEDVLLDYIGNLFSLCSKTMGTFNPEAKHFQWEEIMKNLGKYDYSSAKAILVTSIPGKHQNSVQPQVADCNNKSLFKVSPRLYRYGHLRIRTILSRENLPEQFWSAPLFCQVRIYIQE
jgi:tyrosyl-DNA phosphodiesterase-1